MLGIQFRNAQTGEDMSITVDSTPGRKRKYLCVNRGTFSIAVARFISEDAETDWNDFVQRLIDSGALKERDEMGVGGR